MLWRTTDACLVFAMPVSNVLADSQRGIRNWDAKVIDANLLDWPV